jgi:Zn-dependent protease with chaperone function
MRRSIKNKPTFTSPKSRHFAAILASLITATVIIPGMTTYLPLSTADKIGVPIFMFPFIWVGLFIYCYMAKKSWHAWLLLGGLFASHFVLSFIALTQG